MSHSNSVTEGSVTLLELVHQISGFQGFQGFLVGFLGISRDIRIQSIPTV